MRMLPLLAAFALAAHPAVVSEEIIIEGNLLKILVGPDGGAPIEDMALIATGKDAAAGDGLIQEGFGVASYYMPNRRLNESLEVVESVADRPVLRYTYECDGPNIKGLFVTRMMEPMPNEASVKVTWRIENRGTATQWVAPWVRNPIRIGGTVDPRDRMDVPTLSGITNITESGFHAAARNWVAATDPVAQETLYGVFHVDHTHSFLIVRDEESKDFAFQTAFVPRSFPPGSSWETVYRLNMVRGLTHVDFATDELAAQIEYAPGQVEMVIAPVKALPPMHIHATILGPDGKTWKLPAKKFEISPTRLTRCTYEWTAPKDGAYDFMAQLLVDGKPYMLGKDTGSPHGGIDLQFTVGKAKRRPMEAWSDAPYALERGPRELKRPLLYNGDAAVWAESSAEKVGRGDYPAKGAAMESAVRVSLARNEAESFQIVVRPRNSRLTHVDVDATTLTHTESGQALPANALSISNVAYVPVTVPSHYESASGLWPDPLPSFVPFAAEPNQSYPIWFTLRAPSNAPAGTYKGAITLTGLGMEPVELWLEAEVFNFALPATPSMKTDFGFWTQGALDQCKAKGFTGSADSLLERYRANAFAHRVTLRELTEFPKTASGYDAALQAYAPDMNQAIAAGATTLSVPHDLLNNPSALAAANAFVKTQQVANLSFTQIASAPLEPAWPRVFEAIKAWKAAAPQIPVMVTTQGLNAFLPPEIDIWAIHSQVMDTHHAPTIDGRVRQGGQVWWYVNQLPARPYANLLLDFMGVEHRALFWQAWAMGATGFHYGGVNYSKPGVDPWQDQLDLTPAQGDGFLVYPGPQGPVNSIRWELVRDGLEDCDYLSILRDRITRLQTTGKSKDLVARAANVFFLGDIVPDLVSFPRNIAPYMVKREAIARMIVEIDAALK